jgi:hypothetical protein
MEYYPRSLLYQDDRIQSLKNTQKINKKIASRIGGHTILKTVHSLHFVIVNTRTERGRPEIWAS